MTDEQAHSGGSPTDGMTGKVQRLATRSDGYVMAVQLETRVPVTDWYAEISLPSGASIEAEPGAIIDGKKLRPNQRSITPSAGVGRARVLARVIGTQNAPKHVRVQAASGSGQGNVTMDPPVVTDAYGRTVPATEDNWPGSTTMSGSGGGSGGGGGGGGQGESDQECEVEVDMEAKTVKHRCVQRVRSDAGGGGGAGGGIGGQHQYYS